MQKKKKLQKITSFLLGASSFLHPSAQELIKIYPINVSLITYFGISNLGYTRLKKTKPILVNRSNEPTLETNFYLAF